MRTDRDEIRDLIESWALWRDAGDWTRFRSVWHDDGVMNATWFQGPVDDFIRVSREGFLERRDGRWGIVVRQPIYEKDRVDPVEPAARLELDADLLGRFPEGYRHLAYVQTQIGYAVKPDMPGLTGPEVEALYRRGADWRAGSPAP